MIMCNADVFKDFSQRKLKADLTPDLNPVKQVKTKLKNDFDWTGQQMAQDQYNAELAAQRNRISAANEETRNKAPAGSYIAANGATVSASQRRKRTSLLTQDEDNLTLLG